MADDRQSGLAGVVDLDRHPIAADPYQSSCRVELDQAGVVVLRGFLTLAAVETLVDEAERVRHLAFFSKQTHNVYLDRPDEEARPDDPRALAIVSTKGAVTTDQVPAGSPLRVLYDAPEFRRFLCAVLGEAELHSYADPLSSINVNYFEEGQELGWHFDNSSFAVTLLVQDPVAGGRFEFIDALRHSAIDDDNEPGVAAALDGARTPAVLGVGAGDLVLFRGRDALHRVTPVEGVRPRILVVLAYNTEPGLELSATARMTFFGRLE